MLVGSMKLDQAFVEPILRTMLKTRAAVRVEREQVL